MHIKRLNYGIILLYCFFQMWNCKNNTLTEFDKSVYPEAPKELKISIGDGIIVLNWSHAHPQEIDLFYIYRKNLSDSVFIKIDSTAALTYTDLNVNNGVSYNYGISAVKNGFEGAKTYSLAIVPTVFGLIINSGDEFTNSQTVVLSMVAPSSTAFMKISNDSSLTNAQWEPFNVLKEWTLTESDGIKTVYVHFRDSEDNDTIKPLSDSIILDTKAIIIKVTENTGGLIKSAGDTIHFALNSGEAFGQAFVDIGDLRTNIKLFDDGTQGDNVENDGVYHRDFQIPTGFEVTNANIIGNFTDKLGNRAESVEADSLITIQNPPEAVTLLEPETIQGSTTSLRLTWTQSNAQDFASYKLYRSLTSNVNTSSTFVTSIDSKITLSYLDENLQENTTYYYRVYVFDTFGLTKASNEVKGIPYQNEPPKPVTLFEPQPIQGSTNSLSISWTQSTDQDFASYKLYRSLTPSVSTSSTFVTSIESISTLSFLDDDLQENTTYYYRIFVFDSGGLQTPSNEVSATTLQNDPPEQVTLLDAEPIQGTTTTLRLSWTQSNDQDFASYKLYRSLTPGVSTSSTFVTSIESINTLSFLDDNLKENTTYYYRIYVFDTGGLQTPSNEVSGTTLQNDPPEQVTLLDPEPIQGTTTTLRLSWTQNNDQDFASYKLYRSLTSGVTTSSTFVTSIESIGTLSFLDDALEENTTYYYRVYVFDTGGLQTPSNEVSGTTLQNEPPAKVTLLDPEPIQGTTSKLRLSWTKSTDKDFSSYKLYRSLTSGVSTSSTFVTSIESIATLSFLDDNLKENTTYYYRIYVFDTGGLQTPSNEVSGTTLQNEPPNPVTLTLPTQINNTTLRMTWSQSSENDFDSYRIYRSQTSPVDTTQAPIGILNNISTTLYDDSNLQSGIDYFYRVFVFDKDGLSAGSNEVKGKLN